MRSTVSLLIFRLQRTSHPPAGSIDYKVAPHLSSLVWKDLFYDFGSDDTHLVAGDEPFVLKEDEDFAVVCARLNYHFNSGY